MLAIAVAVPCWKADQNLTGVHQPCISLVRRTLHPHDIGSVGYGWNPNSVINTQKFSFKINYFPFSYYFCLLTPKGMPKTFEASKAKNYIYGAKEQKRLASVRRSNAYIAVATRKTSYPPFTFAFCICVLVLYTYLSYSSAKIKSSACQC